MNSPPGQPSTPIHIVLAFDDNFWAPAYAVMRSVCLTTKRRADLVFHLCHDGLSAPHRTDIEGVAAEFGAKLAFYDLQQSEDFNRVCRELPVAKRLHSVIYVRLLLHLLLPSDIKRVIYLDCDTMVIRPIEHLYDSDIGENALGAVEDSQILLQTGGKDMISKRDLFDPAVPYFNSGVLLIDLPRYAEADVPAKLADMAAQGMVAKLYYDQDMLNLIFLGNWQALNWRFNVIDPRPPHESLQPVILHYTGNRRPWNLVSFTAYARVYRHVMTNELYYRYMRHRWKRAVLKRWKRLTGRK